VLGALVALFRRLQHPGAEFLAYHHHGTVHHVKDYLVLRPGTPAQTGLRTIPQVVFAHGHTDAAAVAFLRVDVHGRGRGRFQELMQGLDVAGELRGVKDRTVLRGRLPGHQPDSKLGTGYPALPAVGAG